MMKSLSEIEQLLITIKKLRSKEGCPWDREQTHESLIPYLSEESAEVVEAILSRDEDHICEELGDLLLQVLLHAEIASEQRAFDFEKIAQKLNEKMIRRHPHVFANKVYVDQDDQKADWEKIKSQEKVVKRRSILDGIAPSLSGLNTAIRLQKKASKVGFDWKSIDGVFNKVEEEINEFKLELSNNSETEKLEAELGDILFALTNVARHLKLDPERALARTNQKFRARFSYIESHIDKPLEAASLEEMDRLWDEAKHQLNDE